MADVIKKATRESYGEALAELGAVNDKIIVFDADLSGSTKTSVFKKAFPDRFFNVGIAEANMMSIGAGAATTGLIPFCSTFAMFAAGRGFEQIRNSIGYPHLNVKIAATHAGLSVGEDGASHQCNEDLALMRVIPGMTVISPSDDTTTKAAIKAAAEYYGPVYIRLGRMAVPVLYNPDELDYKIGKGIVAAEGDDIAIVATGIMVSSAIEASRQLKEEGISARVIDIHTIKPLDKDLILKAAKETGRIVTVEEHSIIGGLGSAVSEFLSEEYPVPVIKIGVNDVFGESGPGAEVLKKYGLSVENIIDKAKLAVSK
jgi:transketolase